MPIAGANSQGKAAGGAPFRASRSHRCPQVTGDRPVVTAQVTGVVWGGGGSLTVEKIGNREFPPHPRPHTPAGAALPRVRSLTERTQA